VLAFLMLFRKLLIGLLDLERVFMFCFVVCEEATRPRMDKWTWTY